MTDDSTARGPKPPTETAGVALAEVLVLPPSEGKASGGQGGWAPASGEFAELGPGRRQIEAAVAAAANVDAARTLGLHGPGLADAVARLADGWEHSPALAAHDRYTGVVYDHLGYASLDPGEQAEARRRIWVVSGLLGLVTLGDPTPEYRCKAGLRLSLDGRMQPCGVWWAPQVSAAIAERAPGRMVELLTSEHRRMLDAPALAAAGIEVIRLELVRADGKGAAGHAAKATKGRLAREMLCDGYDTVARRVQRGRHQLTRVSEERLDGVRQVRWAVP